MTPLNLEAVLFDYGMVLSGPASPPAWAQMLAITGLPEERFHAAYWAPRHAYDRGTHTGADYWRATGRHAGLDFTEDQVAALIAADTELWTDRNQPMLDWAARLQDAGTRTGILSNLGDEMTAGVLRVFPGLDRFHHRVWSHSLKLAKPEPAIYLHAAQGLGTAPERILFIDDREDNIAGAVAVGMQAIHYTGQAAFEAEMETRGLGELWRTGQVDPQ